jgi:hypothetical protein
VRRLSTLIPLTIAAAALCLNLPLGAQEIPPLVRKALANELAAAQDESHPMRFTLRKTSPRLTTTKDLIETRDGTVARLVAVNDQPPTPDVAKKEEERLEGLLGDPGKQKHRKQGEADDTARALKVLRVLPTAFLYQDAGTVDTPSGEMRKFTFTPNPAFNPPDLETQVLAAISGELWVDPTQTRVMHLQGTLQDDVDFGWGVLGRLYKGGWILLDQADVGSGVWRVLKFQMSMSARVLIRTKLFETTEVTSNYAPVPLDVDYRMAIAVLRGQAALLPAGR